MTLLCKTSRFAAVGIVNKVTLSRATVTVSNGLIIVLAYCKVDVTISYITSQYYFVSWLTTAVL